MLSRSSRCSHTIVQRFLPCSIIHRTTATATSSSSNMMKFMKQQYQPQYPSFTGLVRYKSSIPVNTSASSSTKVTAGSNSSSSTSSSIHTIVASLFAALAGVMTVSGTAYMIEQYSYVPKFDMNHKRYDLSTYYGRFCYMILQCDPYLLTYTNQQIYHAKQVVDQYITQQQQQLLHSKSHRDDTFDTDLTTTTTEEQEVYDKQYHRTLWEYQRIYESAMNSDHTEIIPRPFRMSGYVPYNGPICVAMVSSTTTLSLLFWSFMNQSQNALVNYYNGSSSNTNNKNIISSLMDMNSTLGQSYMIAVSSALTVAFGLASFIQRRYSPQQAQILLRYVAFPSAMIASSLNCYIIRSSEIQTGIPLYNDEMINVMDIERQQINNINHHDIDDNQEHSSNTSEPDSLSQIAAQRGVYATTFSRAILQAPVYFIPPVLVNTIFQKYVLYKYPQLTIPITTYLLLCSFGLGLPAAVAIFPQISSISHHDVEPKFQQLINPTTQQPYTKFYYDKGL